VQSAIALEALVSAAFILIGGKVADVIGRKRAYKIGLVFFGLYNLLNGCLILKSSFLPRFLGVFMVIAGLPFLVFLLPVGNTLSPFAVAPAAMGEGLLLVWLLAKGVNAQKWTEQASRA